MTKKWLLLLLTMLCLNCSAQKDFEVTAVPDSIFALMQGRSYGKGCTVARSELRYLRCLHVDAEGRTHHGEMVLNKRIATTVLDILRKLYEAHYPIERMRLVDYYGANDEKSMTANNSSGFNFRFISGTRKVSKHGMGLAVDINPLYNPCVKKRTTTKNGAKVTYTVTEPAAGKRYADRTKTYDYTIRRGDLCHKLFKEAGFRWGGDWTHSKDYQHFEMP